MDHRPVLLVVDDDFDTLDLVSTVAERMGIRCVATADARRCLSLVEELNPQVVLLDLQMPELDGIEVLRQLGAARCSARVTVMSGMDERVLVAAEVLGRGFGLLMGRALRKPVTLGALASGLARLFPTLGLDAPAALRSAAPERFAGFSAG